MHFSSLEKCNLEPWKPNYSIFDANFGCDLQGSVELGRNEKNPRTTQMELTWNPLLTFLEIGTNLEYASEHDPRNQTYTRNSEPTAKPRNTPRNSTPTSPEPAPEPRNEPNPLRANSPTSPKPARNLARTCPLALPPICPKRLIALSNSKICPTLAT